MNMKNITKTGLGDFIASKVSGQRADVRREIDCAFNARMKPVFDSIDCKKFEKLAQTTVEEMEKIIKQYAKPLGSWKYSQVIQNLNQYAVNISQQIRDEIKIEGMKYIERPERGSFDFGIAEVNAAVSELQVECKGLFKKLNNLERLRLELERVIKNEHNGAKAYKALVALGVDMNGFSEIPDMLPAIVKLSVDVCILNGNCE